jgi:hypothetical protein
MSESLENTAQADKKNILSYSKVQRYSECGQKYKYYYIDRIRETTKTGALCFGVAFDKAIEAVLNNRSIDEKAIFDTWWTKQSLNSEVVDLCTSPLVVYSASDFDRDLLLDEDIVFIKAKAAELFPTEPAEWYQHFYACLERRRGRKWNEKENLFFNICTWLSLRRKGHLMLEANRKKVLPLIKRVISTQAKIELKNDNGDTLGGYADLVAELHDGRIVVLDYKTSSIRYEQDAVITSPQLTIYCFALEIGKGGFLVFSKSVLKEKTKVCKTCGYDGAGGRHQTCPNLVNGVRCKGEWDIKVVSLDIDVQIMIEDIPDDFTNAVFESIEEANVGIKNQVFEKNYKACRGKYGPCPYLDLCHNNSAKGLVKL